MPKLELKVVQKELEAGKVRPVYFLYGPERMKSRELEKRIVKAVLRDEPQNDFNFEKWDGSEVSIETILDSAQGFSLMGGTKLVFIRNADEIKQLDSFASFLKTLESTEPGPVENYSAVLVFTGKSFDGRKKASKIIQDLAATIPCEEVPEQDREPWVDYLAKRRGVLLSPSERLTLRGLDPWTLDIVDQELAKLDLIGDDETLRSSALLSGISAQARDDFIDAIFCRDKKRALNLLHLFIADKESQLPLLGLVAWNLRHLKLMVMEREFRASSPEKRNPYLLRNLERWRSHWNRHSIQALEHELFEVDFALKNTPLLSQGLWMGVLT